MSYCLRVPSYCARDDQRTFGTRQGRRCRLNALGVWIEASAAVTPRRGCHAEFGVGFPQDLTRQGQIDWPTRLGHGDFQSSIHYRFELSKIAQLVVPLDVLTQHAGLVKGLLGPVNIDIARPREPGLREGGTAS